MISAVVLTYNESHRLARCLKSLQEFKSIIVVDNFSTDDTVKLARKLGATVYKHHHYSNFAAQRNFALTKVNTPWALFIDADEVVTKALFQEIHRAITSPLIKGFYLKRQDYFLGHKLRYGETASVKLLRLAQLQAGKWRRPVHEVWHVTGPTLTLRHPLLHYPHSTLKDFINSIHAYTDIEAGFRAKTSPSKIQVWFELITFPLCKFILNYFIRLGILDGYPGLVMAAAMSYHSLLVRVKLSKRLKSLQ